MIDLYMYAETVSAYGQNWIGTARDIANNGTIIGEIALDGMLQPVTWDSSITMSFLDLGPYSGTWALGWVINDQGLAGGQLRPPETATEEGTQADLNTAPLIWQNGQLVEGVEQWLSRDTTVTRLSNSGLFTGSVDDVPARWKDGVVEILEMPAGFTVGATRAQNALGDVGGVMYQAGPPFVGGVPFIWANDGTLTVLDTPGGRDPSWAGGVRPVDLSDDGQLVIHAIDGEGYFGDLIRYAGGQQIPIAAAYGAGARLFDSNANGVILGESAMGDIPIPTLWVDDQPIVIADMIVPGPDRIFTGVSGINDNGAIVGAAEDSAGMSYSVVLRPV
jgi:hypothetical protein